MKFNQLRNLVAVAERGSLRAASRHLNLAQPVLTRSIRDLEQELGTPLFERKARGMTLTPMGHVFLPRAQAILAEIRRAQEEVQQHQGGSSGSVAAGLSIVPHISMLGGTLKPFYARYRDIRLHLLEGLYPTLESGLKDGSLDVYIGPPPEYPLPAELTQEVLFENTRTVLGRKGHPLAKAKSLKDLVDAEWATTSITQRAEDEFSDLFTQYNLPPPRLALRSQSALTLMVSLASTDLLAMAPVQWTDFPLIGQTLATIPVREPLPAPPIVVIRRAGLPLTPAAEFFVDLIRRNVPRPRAKQRS
jgi:LysR family transcriptional regulator, regulator of abg operon